MRIEHAYEPTLACYLERRLRLVLVRPRSKKPLCDPDTGSWWQVGEPAALAIALRSYPDANIALLCDGIVQVDLDSAEATTWAGTKGLTSEGTWALRTARGWRFFYLAPEPCPTTHIDPTHQTPDFLGPRRLALVPPSVHPHGHRYAWVRGHSPFELGPTDLARLPDVVVAAWRDHEATPAIRYQRSDVPQWLGLVFNAICDYLSSTGHRILGTGSGGVITTCPLHDDHHPSLTLHPKRGWRCWAGCGEGRLTLLAARLGIRVSEEADK